MTNSDHVLRSMRHHQWQNPVMEALRVFIEPIFGGWNIRLSDGQQLARFRGPWARLRAERFVAGFAA